MNHFVFFFLFFFCSLALCGQEYHVKWIPADEHISENEISDLEKKPPSTWQAVLEKWVSDAQKDLHWLARFQTDTILDTVQIQLFKGPNFGWENLELDSVSQRIIKRLKAESPDKHPTEWMVDVLKFYENNGYPFANLSITDFNVSEGVLSGKASLNPGPYIRIDSISLKGYDKVRKSLLRFELGLRTGMPYSEKNIQALTRRVERIPYIGFARPPQVLFSKEKNVVFLYVEKEKNNRFNGIAGLNSLQGGGVTVTGEVDVLLQNTLNKGERVEIQWRRPGVEMQMLDLDLSIPFPFDLPIGITGGLEFLRQDSSFVNIDFEAGLRFWVSKDARLRLLYEGRRSVILSDESFIEGAQGFSAQFVRLGLEVDNTDHFFLPTKGVRFSGNIGTGTRAGENRANQWIGRTRLEYFQPIWGRFSAYSRTQAGWLQSETYLPNEVFRTGGIQSLRGVNEQSLFASAFFIQSTELRFALDRFSYIQLLGDVGFLENKSAFLAGQQNRYAIGAGMSFQTELGVLQLIYAVGKQGDANFDFQAATLHVGYISRF
jgi:outer membrane protein assembly factor BamA